MAIKKTKDIFDTMIQSINWKIGGFNMLPIFFGTLMAFIDILMMGSVKMISNGTLNSTIGLPLSIGLYALEPLVFLKALNYEGMVVVNLVWNLMSDIVVTLQGILIFGETIKGLRWVALAMALFSLGLFAYTDTD